MALTLSANCDYQVLHNNPTHVTKYEMFSYLKERYEKRLIVLKEDCQFQIESLTLKKDEFFLIDEIYLEHVKLKQNQFKIKCLIIYEFKKYIVTLSHKDDDKLETYDKFKKTNDVFETFFLLVGEKY